jgi:hypothetical protein
MSHEQRITIPLCNTRNSTIQNEAKEMTKDMKQIVLFMFLVWVAVTLVFISQHL